VPRDARALRAQRLRELSTERFSSLAQQQIGLEKEALVLKTTGSASDTLTRDYWPVKLEVSDQVAERKGQEIRVRITGFDDSQASRMDGVLRGEWVTP
jgi:tRNA A37 methylthiotransferase MiaB